MPLATRVERCGLAAGAHRHFFLILDLEEAVEASGVVGGVRLMPGLIFSLWGCKTLVSVSGRWYSAMVDMGLFQNSFGGLGR